MDEKWDNSTTEAKPSTLAPKHNMNNNGISQPPYQNDSPSSDQTFHVGPQIGVQGESTDRLVDDLELLRVEEMVSEKERELESSRSCQGSHQPSKPDNDYDSYSNNEACHTDSWDLSAPGTRRSIRKAPRVVRYLLYALPIALILLIPILIHLITRGNWPPIGGAGGVDLMWFGIWLEAVWGSLWAARLITTILPWLFNITARICGSNNHTKWKEIGRSLELSTALFFWMLAVLCSFRPIVDGHRAGLPDDVDHDDLPDIPWIDYVQKILIALAVYTILNFLEKILIQWIATTFHRRTYAPRINENRERIDFLVQLYDCAKTKHPMEDPIWDEDEQHVSSGSSAPMNIMRANARQMWSSASFIANRLAGDFTGRKILEEGHPRRVVLELLRNKPTSLLLARRIFRSLVQPDRPTLDVEDFKPAFTSHEEAETCFNSFDRDLNGDISMEEMEGVCNDTHLEKKAIAASLKDLDSVIKKLDGVFTFFIFVISAVVLVAVVVPGGASSLATIGTAVLGLAWVLSATAQEFLQSAIFVFVKHPFDVGDRVTIYGNTGNMLKGDDYYVQEISLLYTAFKKLQGHVVQAPNSVLNTLFILNHRRSYGLSQAIELKLRFGTSPKLIEELRERMLAFVAKNRRDYGPRILTEVRSIEEVWSITVNFIFFHKTNWQNELLRLTRAHVFVTELMTVMAELGLEGPRQVEPGGSRQFPFYWSHIQPPAYGDDPLANMNAAAADRSRSADAPPSPITLQPPSHLSLHNSHNPQRPTTTAINNPIDGYEFGDVYSSRRDRPPLSSSAGHGSMRRLSSVCERSPSTASRAGLDGIPTARFASGSSGLFGRTTSLAHQDSRSRPMHLGPMRVKSRRPGEDDASAIV